MINEERVKELCHISVYDAKNEKNKRQMGQYYMWDYVSKEVLKSFASGTIIYLLFVVLWVLRDMESAIALLNDPRLLEIIVRIAVLYVAFLVVYLLLTAIVYMVRYSYGRKKLRAYAARLKKVQKMYDRDEKLKA